MAKKVKIFYSWQSDTAAYENKDLIRECIDELAYKDSECIESDRDTKGVLGTPDIVKTICDKIKECDIFVADITPVCEYKTSDNRTKKAPNANVMFELGYAASLGEWDWNNIVTVINAKYGEIGPDFAFDLSHRRPYSYSFNEKNGRKEAKNELKKILDAQIDAVKKGSRKVEKGKSNYQIGSYDFSNDEFIPGIKKEIDICEIPQIKLLLTKQFEDIKGKIDTISNYEVPQSEENDGHPNRGSMVLEMMNKYNPVVEVLVESHNKEIIEKFAENHNLKLPIDFFDLKGTKVRAGTAILHSGSSEFGLFKNEMISELASDIFSYNLLQKFSDCFFKYTFIPLLIKNSSGVLDYNVQLSITADSGNVQNLVNIIENEFEQEDVNLLDRMKVFEALLFKETAKINLLNIGISAPSNYKELLEDNFVTFNEDKEQSWFKVEAKSIRSSETCFVTYLIVKKEHVPFSLSVEIKSDNASQDMRYEMKI